VSAYTTAWLEAHGVPERDLRERLHEALTVLHEAAFVLECEWQDVSDYAESVKKDLADKEEELSDKEGDSDELIEAQSTIEDLRQHIKTLEKRIESPGLNLFAIREHYAKHGLRVIEGEGQSDTRSADDLYREATEIDDVEPKKAEDLYLRALAIEPAFANARCNLGNLYFRGGNVAKAEEAYRRAIEDDPRCAEAHYNLGYIFLDRGKPKDAVSSLERAVDIDPRFADAWFNLGMACEQTSNRERARVSWQRYLAIEPRGTWADIARKHLEPSKPKRIRRKKTS